MPREVAAIAALAFIGMLGFMALCALLYHAHCCKKEDAARSESSDGKL